MNHNAQNHPLPFFDVDVGGHQRDVLLSQLRSMNFELRATREERDALRKLKRECTISARLERCQYRILHSVFMAWRRCCDQDILQRARERDAKAIGLIVSKKMAEITALTERVARVKANAQFRLCELSEANQKLAVALEHRDGALRSLKRRACNASRALAHEHGNAAGARTELEIAHVGLARAGGRVRALEIALRKECTAREAERYASVQDASVLQAEVCITLTALNHADADLSSAATQLVESRRQAGLHQARLDGVFAEIAWLRAVAARPCNLGEYVCADGGSLASAGPVGMEFSRRSAPNTELAELHWCRHARLTTVFWRWAEMRMVRKSCVVGVAEAAVRAVTRDAASSRTAHSAILRGLLMATEEERGRVARLRARFRATCVDLSR